MNRLRWGENGGRGGNLGLETCSEIGSRVHCGVEQGSSLMAENLSFKPLKTFEYADGLSTADDRRAVA